ncbi:hypothetical protein FNV43_RR17875 [Rhamnella rubrinervis]|uniref:Uncharacterized protein n=1 Tax=Rhamnella rubrinervis TaxID=2594499 RepID=A0A8K0EA88_9ROSA|nr:hypothetical protein FNV43_RR17875 [Rhamnella rubrinervis]
MKGLFGMPPQLLELESHVPQSSDTDNVCFIGIHGMGGIGKSTLVEAYYMKMSHRFDGSSFLCVREVCNREANGLVVLQKQLLKDILEEDFRVDNFREGITIITSRLCAKKVLIILDDVNNPEQLEALADSHEWFGRESVIIVTTRNADLFKERYKIYRAQLLHNSEALQLFSWKVFKNSEPPAKFKEHSKEVVKYASNLPLALSQLGNCFVGKKDEIEWEGEWNEVRTSLKDGIFKKLKISFDELNEDYRPIFLDIACFFSGHNEDFVLSIMDKYGSHRKNQTRKNHGSRRINQARKILIDKSLLMSTQHDGKLQMHYLLQEMGKKIVRQESGNRLQNQSRIWDADDLCHILESHEEKLKKVEAIVANLEGSNMESTFEALPNMHNLRLLMINYLSNEFLLSFQLPEQQPWFDCIKRLYNLKVVDLSFSLSFTKLEGFSLVPNLEALILEDCKKLLEIDPSIGKLRKLVLLNLKFCENLVDLPEGINGLTALQTLKLSGCRKLKDLPDNLEQLKSLRDLELNDSGIKHLPSSIFLMENLKSVSCDEEMIKSAIRENIISGPTTGNCFIPGTFCTFLTRLDLSDCKLTGPEAFPEYFGKLVSLTYLDLSNNPLSVLPPMISGLSGLKSLSLERCKRIERLEPELLPSSLEVDGKMTALASLSRFLEDPRERRNVDFKFVVPQSDNELPSWFIDTSTTASISKRLDPNWRNSELIGFAMVFYCRADSSTKDKFSCNIKVCGSENCETTMDVGVIESRMSDHLFILYSRCEVILENIKQLEPPSCVTLEFTFLRACDRHRSSCCPCGIRLDRPNPKINPSVVRNTHYGVIHKYSGTANRILGQKLERKKNAQAKHLFSLSLMSWRLPGWIKVNVDAVFKPTKATIAMVVRDDKVDEFSMESLPFVIVDNIVAEQTNTAS